MILRKILKIGRKKAKGQKKDTSESSVQKAVVQPVNTDTQEKQVSKETLKKTKTNKINKALNIKGKKTRSKRTVHTKKIIPLKEEKVSKRASIHSRHY